MAKRIDSLTPGTRVRLKFCAEYQGKGGEHEDDAVFVKLEGTGDDRRATFRTYDEQTRERTGREFYEWDAYRFNGRWAYGTSAETLRLVAVTE